MRPGYGGGIADCEPEAAAEQAAGQNMDVLAGGVAGVSATYGAEDTLRRQQDGRSQ
jgi:hypothetical protein